MSRFVGIYARSVSSDGEFLGGAPILTLDGQVVWQGPTVQHDCDACGASALVGLLVTTGVLGLAPVAAVENGFVFERARPLEENLNRLAPGRPAEAEWRHHETCPPADRPLDELAATIREALDRRDPCRVGRQPNCVVERLLDEIEARRG